MLGPLPQLYRILVSVIVLAVFVAGGVLLAVALPFAMLVSVGASSGLAMGGVCAFVLIHEFHQVPAPQTSGASRTRLR